MTPAGRNLLADVAALGPGWGCVHQLRGKKCGGWGSAVGIEIVVLVADVLTEIPARSGDPKRGNTRGRHSTRIRRKRIAAFPKARRFHLRISYAPPPNAARKMDTEESRSIRQKRNRG